ncbi:MAG TPA: phosphotransferase [Pseudobdellovibrionaceae bacterium]|nr:phosphotransferase [Pseudobdellovibrionaceae bacterium]
MKLGYAWGELEFLTAVAEGLEAKVYRGRIELIDGRVVDVAIKLPRDRSPKGQALWQTRWARQQRLPWPYFVKPFLRLDSDWGDLLVEPWIEGETLAQIRARDPHLVARDEFVLQLGRQLLRAWRSLQAEGLVHGDLSPHNLMIDDQGGLAILDAHSGDEPEHLRLSAAFAAPERFKGGEATAQSDLYAVGRVLEFCQQSHESEGSENEGAGRQALVHWVWPCLLAERPEDRHARIQRPRLPQFTWSQARWPHGVSGVGASQDLGRGNLVDS